jgi:hypothetical protein
MLGGLPIEQLAYSLWRRYTYTMHSTISQQREQIALICKRLGIAKLEVFGSATRGLDFDVAKSDADFWCGISQTRRAGWRAMWA